MTRFVLQQWLPDHSDTLAQAAPFDRDGNWLNLAILDDLEHAARVLAKQAKADKETGAIRNLRIAKQTAVWTTLNPDGSIAEPTGDVVRTRKLGDLTDAEFLALGGRMVLGREPSMTPAYREFLTDVITGFYEGRPYSWFDASGYQWFDPDLDGGTADPGPNGVRNAYAKSLRGQNPKNDNSWLSFKLDVDLVHKGCERLKTPIEGLSDRYRGEILGAITANDCGQLDINSYDVIMQAACFDQIVYS